jgi:hypothetical protein
MLRRLFVYFVWLNYGLPGCIDLMKTADSLLVLEILIWEQWLAPLPNENVWAHKDLY